MSDLGEAVGRERAELQRRAENMGPVWTPLDEADPDAVIEDARKPVDAAPMPWASWNRASRDEGGGKGMARGWLALLAATTGTGKSVAGLNIAAEWIRAGELVGYLSLEMSERQLRTRLLAILAGVPVARIEPGDRFDPDTMRRALEAAREIHRTAGGRLFTSDAPLYDLSGALGAMRELRYGHKCDAFVFDYLQLCGNANDPESITAIAHAVRRETVKLGVRTVGLSQFNRATSTSGTRPTVHGLMGGSALENDADQVVIIDQTSIEPSPAPLRGWDGTAVLAKNRHGPSGVEIPIRFDSRTLRMTEILPDEQPAIAKAA